MVLVLPSAVAVFLASLVIKSEGSAISVQGAPATVKDGLTRTVRLTCALNDTAASSGVIGRRDTRDVTHTPFNVAEILSIIVTQNATDVAVVTHLNPVEIKDTWSNNLKVSGQVQNSVSGQGFLEVTWENPSAKQLEDLECRITTMDQSGHSLFFSQVYEFDVTEPSVMDVVAHVKMLEKERDAANLEIQQLKFDKVATDSKLNALMSENNDMKAMIERMGHIETGRICEYNEAVHISGSGTRDKKITVKFQRPYTKPPKVVFGTVHLDTFNNVNLRYTVSPVSVDMNGFLALLHTWADSLIYGVCVDWVSFPP